MNITQRQVIIGFFSILIVITTVAAITLIGQSPTLLFTTIGALVVEIGLFAAYLRGVAWAPQVLSALLTLNGLFVLTPGLNVDILIPVAIAMVLAPLWWVPATGAIVYAVMLARADFGGELASIFAVVTYVLPVAAMFFSRLVTERALYAERESAQIVQAAREQAEAQAVALQHANTALADRIAEQERLIDLVATLETPAVELANGVLLAPIVGQVDTRRSEALRRRLLEQVHTSRARVVVLDISGVTTVDTYVARTLLDTARALQLLGCEVVMSGISTPVAMTLVRLGIDLGEVRTVRSPQEVLAQVVGRN